LSKGGYCTQPNECLCKQGWYGANCNFETQSLCTLDCKNNGKCVSDKHGSYCECTNEFNGVLCEIKIELNCDSSTLCLNGGSCINNACICPPGYTGDRCQLKSLPGHCGDRQCLNDGKCFIDNNNNYRCECKNGYSGKQCEFILDICKRIESPCGSNGVCKSNNFNEYTCECRQGFTGINCSDIIMVQIVSPQQETMSIHEIILITSIGIAFPIICILVLIIIIRMRRYNKQIVVEKQAECYNNEKSIDEKMVKIDIGSDIDDAKQEKQQDNNKNDELKHIKVNFIENNLFNNDNIKEKCNNKSKMIFQNELKQKSINIQSFNGDFNLMASIV
jgi:delta